MDYEFIKNMECKISKGKDHIPLIFKSSGDNTVPGIQLTSKYIINEMKKSTKGKERGSLVPSW